MIYTSKPLTMTVCDCVYGEIAIGSLTCNDIHDRIVAGIVSRDDEATLEALREDMRQIL